MPIVFRHFRIRMTQPVFHLTLRRSALEGPAAEIMPKSVDPSILESDVTRSRRKSGTERLDDLVNERIQHIPGPDDATPSGVEDAAVWASWQMIQYLAKLGWIGITRERRRDDCSDEPGTRVGGQMISSLRSA